MVSLALGIAVVGLLLAVLKLAKEIEKLRS